jgi:hypothetical protein
MFWKPGMKRALPVPPRPMPNIVAALVRIQDVQLAVERAAGAWNRAQLEDAIRSARHFLDLADRALDEHADKRWTPPYTDQTQAVNTEDVTSRGDKKPGDNR